MIIHTDNWHIEKAPPFSPWYKWISSSLTLASDRYAFSICCSLSNSGGCGSLPDLIVRRHQSCCNTCQESCQSTQIYWWRADCEGGCRCRCHLSSNPPMFPMFFFLLAWAVCVCQTETSQRKTTALTCMPLAKPRIPWLTTTMGWLERMPFSQTLMLKQAMRRICGYLGNRSIRAR